jgi:hypothetical protein
MSGPRRPELLGSDAVAGWRGDVAPSARGLPGQQARLRLTEDPALALFHPVVPAAQRSQVAFAGQSSVFPGQRVVIVGPLGGPSTSPVCAGGGADVDLVPELAAGPVPSLGTAVITAAHRDGVEGDAKPGEEPRNQQARIQKARIEPSSGPITGSRPITGCLPGPGLGAARAAMGDRPALPVGDRDAPPGRAVRGRYAGQVTGGGRVQRPERSCLARAVAQPEERCQRDRQVDPSRDPGVTPSTAARPGCPAGFAGYVRRGWRAYPAA